MRKPKDRETERLDVRQELEALKERLYEDSAEQTQTTLTAARKRMDAIRAQLQEKNSQAADLERPVRVPVPDKRLDPDFMSGEPAESEEADAASNSILSPMEDRAILLRRKAELKRRARKSRQPQEPDPSVRWVSMDEPEENS